MAKKYKIEKSGKKVKWDLLGKNDNFSANMLSASHTEIIGNTSLTLDGCLGVYEYTDTFLKLKLSRGAMIICGTDFDIVLFENKQISVRGKISSVEFCV